MLKIYKDRRDALIAIAVGSPKTGWISSHQSGQIPANGETILGFQIPEGQNSISVKFRIPGVFEKTFEAIPGFFYHLFDVEFPIGVILFNRCYLEYDQSGGSMNIIYIFYDCLEGTQLARNKHLISDQNTLLTTENGIVTSSRI